MTTPSELPEQVTFKVTVFRNGYWSLKRDLSDLRRSIITKANEEDIDIALSGPIDDNGLEHPSTWWSE
jgi:hypothetical protein